jgi:hypothetical protein
MRLIAILSVLILPFLVGCSQDSLSTARYKPTGQVEVRITAQPDAATLLTSVPTTGVERAAPPAQTRTPATLGPLAQRSASYTAFHKRPLKFPKVEPGGICPVTLPSGKGPPDSFRAIGDGPVLVAGAPKGVFYYGGAKVVNGWSYIKILWMASPTYDGPVLIRGRQLDGPNEVRFNAEWKELKLDPEGERNLNADHWVFWPTHVRLRAPGCYAYQIDGRTFSYTIVFRAVDTPPPADAADTDE